MARPYNGAGWGALLKPGNSMRNIAVACLGLLLLTAEPAAAQSREKIGVGRLFTNDLLGDGKDRWRTGTAVVSVVRGRGWDGDLPDSMGDLIEFRFRGEVIAPDNLVSPAARDRRYVGALSLGAHTLFQRWGNEFSLGADLVVTGPQSGIGTLQSAIHNLVGVAEPAVLASQIPNGVYPTLTFEMGRDIDLSSSVALRPFVEMQAGVETFVRVGGDIRFGRVGRDALMLRDVTTGQRYRATETAERGFAAILGGDIAYVEQSAYLPASSGFTLTDTRKRLRAGVHWQGDKSSVFYGVTWLGEEFTAQPESQVVGSLRLDFRF